MAVGNTGENDTLQDNQNLTVGESVFTFSSALHESINVPNHFKSNAQHLLMYLLVPVDNVSWMQVFDGFKKLVHHITFVNVFQQSALLYHSMQVRIWYEMKTKKDSYK